VWDTRAGPGPLGPSGPASTREVTVTGVGGVPPTAATAVVLNVTAVNPTVPTFVTVWPTGEPKPLASNLNIPPFDVRANLVMVKVGAGGKVSVANDVGSVDLVADVAGWFGQPSPPGPIADAPAGSATTYQVNAAHDGHAAGTLTLNQPAAAKWSRDFDRPSGFPPAIGYPVKVGGRVFVTVDHGVGGGADLYALDAATGATLWGPILLGGTHAFAALTADSEAVYAVNFDGDLRSFDQATGHQRWLTGLPGQFSFTSPPTASGGLVYVGGAGSGGTLYAVDSRSGQVRWQIGVANGDHSSPAVADGGVYVSYACEVSYRFDAASGELVWSTDFGCSGGGGRTPVVHGDSVYVRDDAGMAPKRLSRATGAVLGTFDATVAPAFDGDLGFFLDTFASPPRLRAISQTTGAVAWTATADGELVTAPIVVDGKVIVGSGTGLVTALDEQTGATVWSANAGAPIGFPDEHNAVQLTGLNVAGGLLLVPAGGKLVAYGA
jgi:outer membrane protein assembly factor BamB